MINSKNIKLKTIAEKLRMASESKTAIGPIRDKLERNDIHAAYQIQSINNAERMTHGGVVTGKKIGLTSESVQKQLGVDQPDFGLLFNDMEVLNGATLPWSETMQPKVEAEIAFVLKNDIIKTDPSIKDIENAIDYALVSLEIVGSRIKDWNINILDTVADNASASHYVLGTSKKRLSEIDIVNCKMHMTVNGDRVSEGKGSSCLGSPLIATQWLAKQMADLGNPLKAGEVILSGALGPMAVVKEGDEVRASIDGLGEVGLKFSK